MTDGSETLATVLNRLRAVESESEEARIDYERHLSELQGGYELLVKELQEAHDREKKELQDQLDTLKADLGRAAGSHREMEDTIVVLNGDLQDSLRSRDQECGRAPETEELMQVIAEQREVIRKLKQEAFGTAPASASRETQTTGFPAPSTPNGRRPEDDAAAHRPAPSCTAELSPSTVLVRRLSQASGSSSVSRKTAPAAAREASSLAYSNNGSSLRKETTRDLREPSFSLSAASSWKRSPGGRADSHLPCEWGSKSPAKVGPTANDAGRSRVVTVEAVDMRVRKQKLHVYDNSPPRHLGGVSARRAMDEAAAKEAARLASIKNAGGAQLAFIFTSFDSHRWGRWTDSDFASFVRALHPALTITWARVNHILGTNAAYGLELEDVQKLYDAAFMAMHPSLPVLKAVDDFSALTAAGQPA
ncbi:hypothetical protein DIPPA_27571 [Diplonema papillatum]|nr:hypothetical protein DIPPA_27571 [Diplonema papillatum]|eukprot:gene6435-9849_t